VNPARPRELRQDPVTRQWVVVAPDRARRPGASARAGIDLPTEEELVSCPFCEGREDRTPPETFAIRPHGGEPDTPGWSVRVVPNLYPVFDHHEVVVSTPRHARSFAELTEPEVGAVATAWRERARVAREQGFPYVHALLNEGREAGASLPHSHTQLAWLNEPPPTVVVEQAPGSECAVCAHIASELAATHERAILDLDGVILLAAYGGRLPYEMLIAPREHPGESAYKSDLLRPALTVLAEALKRLQAVEGPVPVNAWLHDGGHWHLEVLPRLTVFAGIELGAGIYVNSLAPEDAAEALRDAG
jgi:UDPglucose--hexose-1-phosphate uridylyltransferase